ncbi:DUF58 domain-containing protein [Marinobacter profundi]|uniref:DUF58 domain-containing protein n=1 Tax=Marinobacter profundi TaxID=2666256 RepID=A0A2G1UPP4_9GAMM|nr:DUF58 domain-containing protein [Marinobacter profundi]PHQ16448.1 DUF58 domain-containing protein [Marinobacter profundi]
MSETIEASIHVTLPELIRLQADARALRLPGARPVRSRQPGFQRSARRGRGMAFAEVRLYQPGDDIRSIDWRVTARRQTPHTKLYEEERERPILLVCDLGPSLFFASQGAYKQVRCAQLAAILAWLALGAGDQVGGIVCDGLQVVVQRPARRKKAVLQLLDTLARLQRQAPGPVGVGPVTDQQSGGLDQALQEARRVAHTGSRIFVISDFMTTSPETTTLLGALSRHNNVHALRIVDPLEQHLPDSGRFAVAGPEGPIWFNAGDRQFREAWAGRLDRHEQALATCFRTAGVLPAVVSTIDAPAHSLQGLLGPRGRID